MCGIFGMCVGRAAGLARPCLLAAMDDLFILSESRGKEAAGLALCTPDSIEVYKTAAPASQMIRRASFKEARDRALERSFDASGAPIRPFACMGHSRLVTNGRLQVHGNNQPVVSSGIVGIHNGIIVNDEELWKEHPSLHREYEVDTEVLLSLVREGCREGGALLPAVRSTFARLRGTASVALLFQDWNALVLATNNGSLYLCSTPGEGAHFFASERYILKMLSRKDSLRDRIRETDIHQVAPGSGCVIDLETLCAEPFRLDGDAPLPRVTIAADHTRPITDITPPSDRVAPDWSVPEIIPEAVLRRYAIDPAPIRALRRCTRCILPETVPFIEFDEAGVCNFCRTYERLNPPGPAALREAVEPYRRKDGRPECLVTFSGGRDSSYGVHYAKNVLGLNTVAYTYDWGMVTDLARRNIARVCGQLGVEHILVSADIKKKRENIRKNVSAWLRRPDLGTIPLFMAGDKQFFYYANRLRQQMEIDLVFLCINPFERTNFKTGFCGVRQPTGSASIYALSFLNQVKLAAYYGKAFVLNPRYLNSSLLDTAGAFVSFYDIPHSFLNLFRYLMWDEQEVNTTLIQEFEWEVAKDSKTTWRIGDGTAAFYNYIYYLLAGFTENDTFRSHQIREEKLTREQALRQVEAENEPRFDSIRWYCDVIGIEIERALAAIYAAPRRYAPAE